MLRSCTRSGATAVTAALTAVVFSDRFQVLQPDQRGAHALALACALLALGLSWVLPAGRSRPAACLLLLAVVFGVLLGGDLALDPDNEQVAVTASRQAGPTGLTYGQSGCAATAGCSRRAR